MTGETLRKYPDPTARALRATVAAHHGLRIEQVFAGNGSDEVLAHVFQALLKHDKPIRFPDITYSFYPVYAQLYGVAFDAIPLDDAFGIDVDDYRAPSGGVLLPNPNAPTGRALRLAEIEALLKANPDSPVVIDEAYVDFGAESAVKLIDRYPNLLVVQTVSKARSLAGMRVGFAFGDAALIEALTRVKDSFNSYPLDRLAQAAAIAAYEDDAWFQRELREGDRESRTARGQTEGARLRDRAVGGELRVRAPSGARCRDARRVAERERDFRAALQAAAHRPASAHFHRHRCRMRCAHRCVARADRRR